jgi:hypothetical protein
LRIFEGILEGDTATTSDALLRMGVVTVVALVLAVWRLRRMQID